MLAMRNTSHLKFVPTLRTKETNNGSVSIFLTIASKQGYVPTYPFLSYFVVKKIPLSRRIWYAGCMCICMYVAPIRFGLLSTLTALS